VFVCVQHERRFSSAGEINLLRRDFPFFDKTVRHNHKVAPVKEVEHPIMDALQTDAKLVNAVPEQVGFRAPEFMAQLGKTLQANTALILRLGMKPVEPFQKGDRSVGLLKEYDCRFRHRQLSGLSINRITFAYLRTSVNGLFGCVFFSARHLKSCRKCLIPHHGNMDETLLEDLTAPADGPALAGACKSMPVRVQLWLTCSI
jgi:hypothetical protein